MIQDKTNNVSNVPPLRFPEFNGEWEKCIFADICKITTGNKNTQDKEDNGIYPFYVRSQQIERINSYTFDGEAVLTAGDGVGVGKVFHYSKGKIGVHQRVYILCDFIGVGKYIYYYFTKNFYNRVKRMSAKNSVDSVRYDMIAQMSIYMPSVPEQDKIASLLTTVDQRIATQIRVIDKLESLIKGISKKLLAKQGNTYIKDCLICNSSTLQETNVTVSGKYPAWGATGISGYIETPQVEQDAILIIKDGASVGNVRYASGKYGVIGTLNYLTTKNGYNLKYLYYCLRIFNFTPFITGLAIPHIYFRDYGNAQIYCPSEAEQKHIAENLSNIESKIEVEKQILDKLKEQKSYLLSQMFI